MFEKRIALLIIGICLTAAVIAQDMSVTLEVGSVKQASAPRLLGDQFLFTYSFGAERHGGRVHSVEVAFAHEEFSTLYAFERNENEVYVFLYDPPADIQEIEYRLVVDGIWTTDPENPDMVTDRWGVRLSRTVIPPRERTITETPIVHDDNTVEFVVSAPEASTVSVAGSFNGWDPFMTPLSEIAPGRYSRRIRLGTGEHLYYYVVDGLRLPDPQNSERKWHTSGTVVSVVSLP